MEKKASVKKSGDKNSLNSKRQVRKLEVKVQFNFQKFLKWALIGLGVLFLLSMLAGPLPRKETSISQLLTDIKAGKVEKVTVEGDTLDVYYKDSSETIVVKKESLDTFSSLLKDSGIDPTSIIYSTKDQSITRAWGNIIELLLPVVFTGLIFLFIFRQMRGAQDSVFSFGKNRAKVFIKGKQNVKFADVGGVDEVKQELEEIVDFLKNPKKYQQVGAKTPKGVLLVGPAGTGKTLLARAVAGEADVPFFSMAGSEFMEMLVGVGASRVRDLFDTAKKASPAIIFIDEIDAIGRQRGLGVAGGHDEREQTLNQILVEMDGFTPRDNVIVLAATNRGDLLDPALMRPGRFDRRVTLSLPDIEGRKHILKIHAHGKPITEDIDWDKVSRRTVGFSGADLENMLNEAAINAARDNREKVSYLDIEEAATKVKLGPQKRRIQTEEDRLLTAYHEAGHALCAYYMPKTDPVHRISIISRGEALGYTQVPPERDKYNESKSELLDMGVMMLGGRAAEEIQFNEITGGAASDIAQITMMARRMVVDYGMSAIGPINLGPQTDRSDYGRAFYSQSDISQELQAKVDSEIKKIVDECHDRALKTLRNHKDKLDLVSKTLMEKETLEREEFEELMKETKGKSKNGELKVQAKEA